MTGGDTRALESARLRVFASLPRRHQEYFCAVVRQLCTNFVARVTGRGRSPDAAAEVRELSSEVMAKLFGAVRAEPLAGNQVEEAGAQDRMADDDPKRDARVAWLIAQVGGPRALTHRYEDIRRRRFGGKWSEHGYRHVQLEPEHVEGLSVDPDDPNYEADIRSAWLGLLALAKSEFRRDEDPAIVLDLMENDPEIQSGFDKEWPIAAIVAALNRSHPTPSWNDDRVENAKRRLKNWIVRLMRNNGLDTTDLMDLLARHGRRNVRAEGYVPALRSRGSSAGMTTSE
jgi:hypothetical protein